MVKNIGYKIVLLTKIRFSNSKEPGSQLEEIHAALTSWSKVRSNDFSLSFCHGIARLPTGCNSFDKSILNLKLESGVCERRIVKLELIFEKMNNFGLGNERVRVILQRFDRSSLFLSHFSIKRRF
jgi:hypothetical protein